MPSDNAVTARLVPAFSADRVRLITYFEGAETTEFEALLLLDKTE